MYSYLFLSVVNINNEVIAGNEVNSDLKIILQQKSGHILDTVRRHRKEHSKTTREESTEHHML